MSDRIFREGRAVWGVGGGDGEGAPIPIMLRDVVGGVRPVLEAGGVLDKS